jgi:hypothetical protein
MFWRICRYVSAGAAAAVIAAIALLYTAENDRANFTISGIGFDPFPLVANKRTYIALKVKNTGHNYGTITAASLDRVNVLPTEPTYDPAKIASDTISGGDEKRIISDLGDKPLAFTQQEINGLSNGHTYLKMAGFITYRDKYWLLGNSVVGFCYVWNPTDTSVGNFDVCSEGKYTYARTYWFSPGIRVRDVPIKTVGTQTMTPTTMPMQIPDPPFHIQTLELRPK